MTEKVDKYIKSCKRVSTYNSYKNPNGWLLEIMSDRDGWSDRLKGQIYLTVVAPHNHKGFHVHARAMYHFTCIKGQVKSVIYSNRENKREIVMGEGEYKTIKAYPGEAHCLVNDADSEAFILTHRDPAWTAEEPDILTISPTSINTDEAWEKIEYFNKLVKK